MSTTLDLPTTNGRGPLPRDLPAPALRGLGDDSLAMRRLGGVPAVRIVVHRVSRIEGLETLLDLALEVPVVAGGGAGRQAIRGRLGRAVRHHAGAVVHAALGAGPVRMAGK